MIASTRPSPPPWSSPGLLRGRHPALSSTNPPSTQPRASSSSSFSEGHRRAECSDHTCLPGDRLPRTACASIPLRGLGRRPMVRSSTPQAPACHLPCAAPDGQQGDLDTFSQTLPFLADPRFGDTPTEFDDPARGRTEDPPVKGLPYPPACPGAPPDSPSGALQKVEGELRS